MSALAQTLQHNNESESVTTISAVARVDYILRFSKHAVLVVDEESGPSSDVGHQFLANLPDEHNAAYVTMSAKLNDLQVRCRLVEQLFGSVLFDPEQSVAVSLVNLVKQQNQAVTIVVDNAQHLSLQLLHELTQLAEIARKADYQISVLLLGTHSTGRSISQNLSLFNKKLSIVSASTGQLVSHQAKIFNHQLTLFNLTPLKKWLAFFLLLSFLSSMAVYQLYQRDVFAYSSDIKLTEQKVATVTEVTDKMVGSTSDLVVPLLATPFDILEALSTKSRESVDIEVPDAVPTEIVAAIKTRNVADLEHQPRQWTLPTLRQNEVITVDTSTIKVNPLPKVEKAEKRISENSPAKVTNDNTSELKGVSYYMSKKSGYVIQIAGFTQRSVMEEFLADYSQFSFYQYQRVVNDELMTFITTEHFTTREQASEALASLPENLKNRSPWIKSVTAINTEISSFQRSQS